MRRHLLWVMAAVMLGIGLVVITSAGAAVTQVGTLTPSGSALGFFDSVTASGDTVLATAELSSPATASGGAIDVFTEPAAGWGDGSQAATLVDPSATYGPLYPSISGGTVVANYATTSYSLPYDDVFVEPAGGWSGTVTPVARLVAPGGGGLGVGVVSGTTIVAAARNTQGNPVLYVFVEPAGGWSGTVMPSATLADSDGWTVSGPAAISGDTIFAGAQSSPTPSLRLRGEAFTGPAGGWSGTVHQSATFTGGQFEPTPASNAVASIDSIFREPAAGWQGSIAPSGSVFPDGALGESGIDAFSGKLAVATTDQLGSDHECPCTAQLFVFSEPAGGWSGTVAAQPAFTTTTENGDLSTALLAPYLFATGGTGIQVYEITGRQGHKVAAPTVSHALARGLAQGRPRLSFTIATASDAPPVESFTLSLPKGLTFTSSKARLAKNLSLRGAPAGPISLVHGVLDVQLNAPRTKLSVTITAGALKESTAMIHTARRHTSKHAVTATLRAALATSDVTTFPAKISVKFTTPR
jgi:hypothetical protein